MDGLIRVDKPQGMTSHDVVASIRRILNQKQVGHFGTLDPLATGLLLVAVGRATRLFPFYSKLDKIYSGEMRLGFSTNTYDSEGTATSEMTGNLPSPDALGKSMSAFIGPLNQVPPPFSAKKLRGKPLYKWARAQKTIRLKASPVSVYAFVLKGYAPPFARFEVHCSSGTYIRSLIHDLGQVLGCGAHLVGLRRLAIGGYGIQDAISLGEIDRLAQEGNWSAFMLPLESLLPATPRVVLSESGRRHLQKGKPISSDHAALTMPPDRPNGSVTEFSGFCRLFSREGRLLALARPLEGQNAFLPLILF